MNWLSKIINRIAIEVHKDKLNELEARIIEMEKNQQLILKSISDNEKRIEKIDDRVYNANIESASAIGAIKTFIEGRKLVGNSNNQEEGKS